MAVKVIGTGGDYTTIQAWEDALLATVLEDEEGQCKNQEFTAAVDFSAHDTTLGRITLTTQAGASFKDNVNVRTNALRYNSANGMGLTQGAYATKTISVSGTINRLTLKNLQIKNTSGTGRCLDVTSSGNSHLYQDLIIENTTGSGAAVILYTGTCVNIVVIQHNGNTGLSFRSTTTVIGGAVVVPSNLSASGTGCARGYDTPVLKDVAIFGFTTCASAGFGASSANNATDNASGLPGSNNQHSVTYSGTSPFVNSSAASSAHDFRLANDGNALINNGVYDGTNAPNDISGTTRNNPPEIGVWELAAAAAAAKSLASGNMADNFRHFLVR